MADKPLSAREAALLAQASRLALAQTDPVEPAAAAVPAPGSDAAARIAALMEAARAETERNRRRQKMLYVWVPFAFMAVSGLWTLLWMWNKL